MTRARATQVRDGRLRWPDTFSRGPDGRIDVNASHIMDMSWYEPENLIAFRTKLWSFDPVDASLTGSTTSQQR